MNDEFIEKEGKGKLTLVQNSPITVKQILKIFQRTPAIHIHQRPGKGGETWDYVTGVYVKKTLNFVFGWLWNFEIAEHGLQGDQIWVKGKLTILNPKTYEPMIVKMQFGSAEVKFRKDTRKPLNFGNDLKAAATDALKKCASELGIASDVYGKQEFKEIGIEIDEKAGRVIVKNAKVTGSKKDLPQFECHKCAEPLTKAEAEFSKKRFGKTLCRTHQKEARPLR